jgi:hypothetical protein
VLFVVGLGVTPRSFSSYRGGGVLGWLWNPRVKLAAHVVSSVISCALCVWGVDFHWRLLCLCVFVKLGDVV